MSRPSPPLLRPPPRRRASAAFLRTAALLAAGAALGAGATLGLVGRAPEDRPAPVATSAPPPTSAPPVTPSVAAAPERAELTAELEALRRAVATEQARLDRLVQERAAALAAVDGTQAQRPRLSPLPPSREEGPTAGPRPVLPAREEVAVVAARPGPPPLPPIAAAVPAAPRPPRPEAAAAGAGGLPRVVVHHRAGSPTAQEAAQATLSALREAGFEAAELRAVGAVPSQRVVRYFHAEDAATAARLAGRLGRGWAIQDFRAYEPSPSQQLLEVWLPER
jgi:hypothetical protein